MNTQAHLSTMMPKDMADLFMTEIIKSLNQITFNGERKIIAVRKYGNAIAVTVEPFGRLPKEAYNFSLASKQADVVLDGQQPLPTTFKAWLAVAVF